MTSTEGHAEISGRLLYDVGELVAQVEAGYTLLTPNRRLALHIRNGLAARHLAAGETAWQPAKVLPLDAWLEQRWLNLCHQQPQANRGLHRVTRAENDQLWRQVVRVSGAGQRLLQTDRAAQLAAKAYETLLQWQVEPLGASEYFHFSEDGAVFLAWVKDFEKLCVARSLITSEQCTGRLLDAAADLAGEKLMLIEMEDIPPLHAAVIAQADPQMVHHRAVHNIAASQILACPSEDAEIYAAAHWARRCVAEDVSGSKTVGVLMPELTRQRDRVERIFNEVFDPDILRLADPDYQSPFNFSASTSLADAPVIKIALALLSLLQDPVDRHTLTALLYTRFCCHSDADYDRRVSVSKRLHEQLREQLDGDTVRFLLLDATDKRPPLALGARLQQVWNDRRRTRQLSAAEWAMYIWEVLCGFGWPGEIDEHDIVPVEQFIGLLERFSSWRSVYDRMGLGAALQLLKGQLEQTQFQEKSNNASVQILGRLEGAGLQFSDLWLTSCGASQWPTPAAPNPFIPNRLQRELDLPHGTPERELTYCEALTRGYLNSANEVVFSFVTSVDEVEQGPSALLGGGEVSFVEEFLGLNEAALFRRYWSERAADLVTETVVERSAAGLHQSEVLPGGAGLIEAQSNCGFRAFVRYGLGVEALPQPVIGLSALERGNLAHDALHRFWADLDGREALLALTELELSLRLRQVASESVSALPSWRRKVLGNTTLVLEQERLAILMARWLKVEAGRQDFLVESRELSQELNLGGTTLRLRIDRVDRLADGTLLLIDYKTGQCAISDWEGDRPRRPQLPLYAIAIEEVAAIAYGRVTMDKPALLLKEPDPDHPDGPETYWQGKLEGWRGSITALLNEYLQGIHHIRPLEGPKKTCQYCEYAPVCRKHEWEGSDD